jgi:hypothetical protein
MPTFSQMCRLDDPLRPVGVTRSKVAFACRTCTAQCHGVKDGGVGAGHRASSGMKIL